jgi:catechol 2,3-dioxygenase-like lactoylglutathione lyase family enzyme
MQLDHMILAVNDRDMSVAFHRDILAFGCGRETGARGAGPTLYFFDLNEHLIEVRHYEEVS